MYPATRDISRVKKLLEDAYLKVEKAYEIIEKSNRLFRQFDYTTVSSWDIGLEWLLIIVEKLKRLYYQEE